MPQVDYDALASTHGGTLNYDALAAAHGAAASTPTSTGAKVALAGAAVANAAPGITRAVEEIATHPGLAKAGSVVGQVMGGVQGAMRSPLDAAGGAWAGGKAGWFTGKLIQKLSAPVASALEKAAPILKETGPLLGSFGAEGEALDRLNSPESLAEFSKHLTPAQQTKFETLLKSNSATPAQDIASVKKLIAGGTPPSAAVKEVAGDSPVKFGSLMTLYLRSRQVK